MFSRYGCLVDEESILVIIREIDYKFFDVKIYRISIRYYIGIQYGVIYLLVFIENRGVKCF